MNDTHKCDYVSKIEEKFEDAKTTEEDNTEEACLIEKQSDGVINKNIDLGILKEQNSLSDNSSFDIYSNLYSNKNFTNNDYISSNKERHLAGLNDIRNVCDDFTSAEKNEVNSKKDKTTIDSKENDVNFEKISSKINEKNITTKDCQEKKVNGIFKDPINMLDSNEILYYAVHIPVDFAIPEVVVDTKGESPLVYTDKEEVLKVMKLNKKARFKQFRTKKEAEEFAINGAEILSQEGSSGITDNEKVMPFKRPKTEDMIQFRKDIEKGDIDSVKKKIYENPKYLVSNGDTPSILQEGSRYNALHVAAKEKNAKITQLILDSITCIDFIGYLYDDNDVNSCASRSEILLDRYLNTPDKGLNETPLHLAVKHGAVEVVQVLLSYSQCQKNIYNRYHELPRDIICSRVYGPCQETRAAITSILDEQYFVPVVRSEDNSLQPKVGEAFSLTHPLKLQIDLLSPKLEIQAYAGPMSKEKADLFKKKWKNPSRSVRESSFTLSLRLRDAEKGLEKTGRTLASELQVPWQEYWSFLDTFIDLSSEQGLKTLENYLKNRFQDTFDKLKKERDGDSSVDSTDKSFCPINDLCETFEMCGSQDKHLSSPVSRSKRHLPLSTSLVQREHHNKKSSESLKHYGKNPLVYVEKSCEVFGKRIGAAISSCILYENHAESLKECLETQIKHLLSLIKSYREDNRFQSVDFQLIHSRVAAVAVNTLQDMTKRQLVLTALKEIDWNDGTLSDDEDLNYNYRSYNNEWSVMGVSRKQLHCLVKNLIAQLHDFKENALQPSPSARDESDCQTLWALAVPCNCTWGVSTSKRNRSVLKRKQFRNDCETDCDVSPRKIQFEDDKEEFCESLSTIEAAEDSDDHFSTPTSGNSDSEDMEEMEDVNEIPNTFIYPGSSPSKTDYDVLEAIEKVPLSSQKYPNIYLWRHILQMQPKSNTSDHHLSPPLSLQKRTLNFDTPKSSPRKVLDRSFGSCESPSIHTPSTLEPWERVTGPYSPRRSNRSSLSLLFCESSLVSRVHRGVAIKRLRCSMFVNRVRNLKLPNQSLLYGP